MADTPSPKTAPPPSKKVIFLRRLLSSVILWAVVIGSLFSGNKLLSDYVFLAIMMILSWAGLVEFYNLLANKNTFCFKWVGVTGGVLLMGCTFFYVSGRWGSAARPSDVNNFETTFLILFVLGLCVLQFVSKTSTAGLIAISTTLFGLMYVPYLLNFIQKINYFPHLEGNGAYYIIYFILVTKFSDLGAYVTGSLIGKHKMIPRVSPGKTWEGFGGAIVISTGVSILYAHLAASKLVGMNLMHATILGVLLSLAAVVGDLIESIFKREAGVKDSGKFFPGIGGILDLIDSILFNAPIMYLYLRHVLT